jgi:predicted RNase H-like HicB family nuclease
MVQTFHASIKQEGDKYIAECLEIDLTGEGESREQAFMDLREALFIHFEELRPFLKIYLRAV